MKWTQSSRSSHHVSSHKSLTSTSKSFLKSFFFFQIKLHVIKTLTRVDTSQGHNVSSTCPLGATLILRMLTCSQISYKTTHNSCLVKIERVKFLQTQTHPNNTSNWPKKSSCLPWLICNLCFIFDLMIKAYWTMEEMLTSFSNVQFRLWNSHEREPNECMVVM